MYKVSIMPEEILSQRPHVQDNRYLNYTLHLHNIEVAYGRIINNSIKNIFEDFVRMYESDNHHTDYPNFDFRKELEKAFREYRGDWKSCMICEFQVDYFALLREINEDTAVSDEWYQTNYARYLEEMKERAKRRGQKHLTS